MTQPSTTALRPGEGGFGSLVLISIECKMNKELSLESIGVVEINNSEKQNLQGGGWLADIIASVVHYVKCSCHSSSGEYHDAMNNANHGGIR